MEGRRSYTESTCSSHCYVFQLEQATFCELTNMQRVNRVSEHLLGWNWTRLLVAANPARCGGSLANDRYKLPDASGPTTDN